ncbi:hypothetical protein [Phytohabitans rumicis]|uniref:Uncharacterized protein n=1 Tax=Phytohabitans rumicis TaxID=1076125 RepID=A0A6V8LC99_9ACTN|nr:hypothetical protein [Phytohabitans rumicis]GFJ91686.1 hypothetical protein Prum_053280 [Phytohabitans rumicis]
MTIVATVPARLPELPGCGRAATANFELYRDPTYSVLDGHLYVCENHADAYALRQVSGLTPYRVGRRPVDGTRCGAGWDYLTMQALRAPEVGQRVELDAAGQRQHAAHALAVAELLDDDGRASHPVWCRRRHGVRQAHASAPAVLPGAPGAASLPGEAQPLHVYLHQGDRGVTLVMVEAYDPAVAGTQPAAVLSLPVTLAVELAGTVHRLVERAQREGGTR